MSEQASATATTNGTAGAILILHAQTSLHPGCGTALGTVDLPVQRERHTQWPLIPGSTLKGIARDACRRRVNGSDLKQADNNDTLQAAFGPPAGQDASKHAGAVAFTDARILAYPVRSLKGVFAWTTCPAVLERLVRDLNLAGIAQGKLAGFPRPDKDRAVIASSTAPLVVDGSVVLEEFDFAVEDGKSSDGVAEWIASYLPAGGHYKPTMERLKQHLVVLHDDDFTHFVRHATEVVARVGLDYERKTVKKGALFYQEFLPPETLFYSVVLADRSRREGVGKTAAEMLAFVQEKLPPVLQIGGDETVGKGICGIHFVSGRTGKGV